MKKIVLENSEKKVSRVFPWDGNVAHVICRADNRRLELHAALELLEREGIHYKKLATIDPQAIASSPIKIDSGNHLRLVDKVDEVLTTPEAPRDDRRATYASFALVIVAVGGLLAAMLSVPKNDTNLAAELEQQVVQIVKKIPPKPQPKQMVVKPDATVKVDTNKKFNGIKRLGALAVLGSMSHSNQKGGLDLNAVNTTAGPGLGGTGGSGGVQTSIYARGITSAPLGAGSNMAGGGGYGTKGKGGGKAGYGRETLVGSAGNMPIALGREAIIEGGLDFEAVAAVVRRNMGQVRFCYEQGLQLDPKLAGRVGVKFVIGADGMVKSASVDNTTLNSDQIEQCILLRLRSWKFPLPDGGVDVKVAYPFSFNRTNNG